MKRALCVAGGLWMIIWLMPTTFSDGQEIDVLIKQLEDENVSVRISVVSALAQKDEIAEATVPALIKAIGDTGEEVCGNASAALARMGPSSQAAVPVLIIMESNNGRSCES